MLPVLEQSTPRGAQCSGCASRRWAALCVSGGSCRVPNIGQAEKTADRARHDSRLEGEFAQSDIVFLQGVANILGMAIGRQRMEGDLRQAVDRQQLLIKEVNHG
jgi:hypothetical protein